MESKKELAHPSDKVLSGNPLQAESSQKSQYANDAGFNDIVPQDITDIGSSDSDGSLMTLIRDQAEVYEQLVKREHVQEGQQGEIQDDKPSKDKDGINLTDVPPKIHSDKKSHEAVEEDCKAIQENKLICTDKLSQKNNSLQGKVMTPNRELEKVDDQHIEREPVQEGQQGQIQVMTPNRELKEVDDQLIESEPVQEGRRRQIQDDKASKDEDSINVMPPNRELEEVDDQGIESEPVQEGQRGQIQDGIPSRDDDGINENARKHSESLLVAERNQQTLLYILVVCVFLYFIFVQKL